MPRALLGSALSIALCFAALSGHAQPTASPTPAHQPAAEACYAGYGLGSAEKVKTCSEAIDSGALKGLALGLAYFNRGRALSNSGDTTGAEADYKRALKQYNDVIRVSQPNAQILYQRGLIYHTMGDADSAIVDYSDAIRIAPRDVLAYVNRGIVLYTKKDNNEGAIADFDSALKLDRCQVTAWINRGLVFKRKGNLDRSIADLTSAIACLPANAGPVRPANEAPAGTIFNTAYFQAAQAAAQLADAHYQRGLVYLDKAGKDKKQAIPSSMRRRPISRQRSASIPAAAGCSSGAPAHV
jgi:tetratricopeptide (TPR) repeat protein